MFKSQKDATLTKKPGDINGIDFMIKDLHGCTVYLLDHTAQIQLDKCTNCKFFIGPIKGSIFIRDCKDCEFSVACSQFRCRDLYNSKVYLFVSNNPCIESSDTLEFAPYNFTYPMMKEHAASAGLKVGENCWDLIHDFTEREDGVKNYTIIEPKNWKFQKVPVEGNTEDPSVVFSYPVRYGGTIPDDAFFGHDDDGVAAFDIKKTS